MQSLDEKIKSLEILDILKDMLLPLGMAELLKNDLIKDPETARAAVEAFKAMDKLMRKSSGGSIVDSVPGLPSS